MQGKKWKHFQECYESAVAARVVINRSIEHGTVSYYGLATCKSVWVCPVCSRIISERKKVEMEAVIDAHRERGGTVMLLTLTFPHQVFNQLEPMLAAFSKARSRFWGHSAVKYWKEHWGFIGSITAVEVTNTDNGWHPHAHVLLFLDRDEDSLASSMYADETLLDRMKRPLYEVWSRMCQKCGLDAPDYKHGIDLRHGRAEVAGYLSKWGMASEVAKGRLKEGRDGSRTPWQLLADAVDGDDEAAGLFRDYANAFKGKRQTVWSRGLRALFGLKVDKTDEEYMAPEDMVDELASVSREDWYAYICNRNTDLRSHLLDVAQEGGQIAVDALIDWLRKKVEQSKQLSQEE